MLDYCMMVYLDDILIYVRNLKDHIKQVRVVLQ